MRNDRVPEIIRGLMRYVLTLGIVARAYLLAPFVRRHRAVLKLISRNSRFGAWLGDAPEEWKPRLPVRNVHADFSTRQVILPFEEHVDGSISPLELATLAALVRHAQPRRIFEIGTFNGLTTLAMALNAPPDAQLFTLDLPARMEDETGLALAEADRKYIRKTESGRLFHRGLFPEEKKITQLFGDSATFDYAPYVNSMDLVFIDGSHAYDYVMSDTLNAIRLLRGGRGWLVWHDYNTYWPGVIRALEELHGRPDFQSMYSVKGTALVLLHYGGAGSPPHSA